MDDTRVSARLADGGSLSRKAGSCCIEGAHRSDAGGVHGNGTEEVHGCDNFPVVDILDCVFDITPG